MKTQSTTKGFAILSAAEMAVKLLSLLYVPILQIIIGPQGFGVYGGAYSVFAFIYIVTNTGLSSAISKIVSELIARQNYRDAVKAFKIIRLMMFVIGLILGSLMLILARPLANITNFPKAYLAIGALAPAVIFTSIASAYRGYFQGRGNMNPTAVSKVLEQIANIIFSLLFATLWMKYGIIAGCAGSTVGTSVGALISVAYLSRYYKKNKAFKVPKGYSEKHIVRYTNKELLKKIIDYAAPLTITWGAQNAGNLVDTSNTKGRLLAAGFNDAQGNIKYSYIATNQTLINVPITIISALCTTILPLISKAAAVNDTKKVRRGVEYAFKTCLLIAIPSAFGLAVLSRPVFALLFSANIEAAYLMKYYSFVLVLMAVVQVQTTILQSVGKLYLSTFYIIIGIAAKIAINYFLISIPNINVLGAVFGSIAGFLIPFLLNNYVIKKTLRVRYNLMIIGAKPFAASAFMGLVAYLVNINLDYLFKFIYTDYITRAVSTLIAILAGVFVYVYALALVGGITLKDLEAVPLRLKKFIPKFILKRIR